MPFEKGSVSFRVYYVPRSLPDDAVESFAANAHPGFDSVLDSKVYGWVTGRHLLDRKIDEGSAIYGNHLRLQLLIAERKVPASLYKAEVQQEEEVRKAVRGLEFLSRRERKDIREDVKERMLPKMPPSIKGIPFVQLPDKNRFYAGALSDNQSDDFITHYNHAIKVPPKPFDPLAAALLRKKVDVRDWTTTSFSADVPNDQVDDEPGRDFLTWLWFFTEEKGGELEIEGVGRVGMLMMGPLVFTMEGGGAHETKLSKGNPVQSAEAKTSLLAGKKLSKAKLTMAIGREIWETGVSDDFVFRGMKLPDQEEKLDAVSLFMDRMRQIDTFVDVFYGCYDIFIEMRSDSQKWSTTVAEMRAWAKKRKGMR